MVQQNGQSEATGPRICDVLKATREKAGQDLQAVAQMLRIRYVYLHAIEEGRYDDLPGKTYVMGFVRAYADYLGLDVEQVVSRFKVEYDTVEGKADLVFPSPVTEQSVPTGAVILIGLIVLAGAYGGWYFLSSQDRTIAELVPDLSARFEEILETAPADEPDKGLSAEMTGPVTSATPVVEETIAAEEAAETATLNEAVEEAQLVDEQASVTEETKTIDTNEAVEEAEATTVTETAETLTTASSEAQIAAVEESTEVVEAVETVTEQLVETPTPPVAPQETPQEVEVSQVEEPQTATSAVETIVAEDVTTEEDTEVSDVEVEAAPVVEPAAPNRDVVIEAVDFAWVQVTDVDGNVLFTQVLNEGDTYTVPRQENLFLRTGNAGGLRVKVDGEAVPQIGQVGEVRRRVILNPDRLIAGDAVEE